MECKIHTEKLKKTMIKRFLIYLLMCFVGSGVFSQTADDYFAKACTFTIEGHYSKAIKYYTKTINADNSLYFAYLNRASTYIMIGKNKKALADVDYYINDIDHANTQALEMRGILLVEQNKYAEALSDLIFALENNPENTYLNYYLGIAYFELQDYPKTIEYLDKYLIETPDDWESYYYLAKCYCNLNDKSKCIVVARKSISLIEQSSPYKKTRKAKRILEQLVKKCSTV